MELRPCPFCESTDVETAWHEQLGFWVTCNKCYATGKTAETEEAAIESWNHRSESPNDPLTLDELRKMDGEPILLETGLLSIREQLIAQWEILTENEDSWFFFTRRAKGFHAKDYGVTWIAYCRNPEVAPVKYGRWDEIRDANGELEGWIHKDCGREVKSAAKFCPNCGAKMEVFDG